MPIMRITQGPVDEEGHPHGEVVVEPLDEAPYRVQDGERERALLAEAQRDREAERYAGLVRQPTMEPLTAPEAQMAEKSQEQRDRESVSTEGQRFQQIQQQEEEKMRVENALTSHAGITKVASGQEVRLITTAENYGAEPGERQEGIKLNETPPLGVAQSGGALAGGLTTLDDAERKLQPMKLGSASSAQHATGTDEPHVGRDAAATGRINEVEGNRLEEGDFHTEEGHEAARKAADRDADREGPSTAQEDGSATNSPRQGNQSGESQSGSQEGSQEAQNQFSGHSAEDLESKFTAEELRSEAERRGLEVKRSDGKDGAPLKADYAKALSAK